MTVPVEQLIAKIHASSTRLVIAVAGGGSRAIGELAEMPGASRTLLEAVVPYSAAAMIRWLGGMPDQFCSARTARAMAMAAYLRACELNDAKVSGTCSPGTGGYLAGVAATASLASDRPKRGPHRVHLAVQTASQTFTKSLTMAKDRRNRREEEGLVGRLVLGGVAEACGLTERLDLKLLDDESLEEQTTTGPQSWQDLLGGRVRAVRHGGPPQPADAPPGAIFPGAFDPMHAGHRRMVQIAQAILDRPVELEISIENVDKPPLDFFEIQRRLDRIGPDRAVWLTRSATFEEKSALFPGATFVVGTDTLERIADPAYYVDDSTARGQAIGRIAARGCRFLVFGRTVGDRFQVLADLDLPEELISISTEVPADRFREDVSSTDLRGKSRS